MSILNIDNAMNGMDQYAEALVQWEEAYQNFLDRKEINRMFEFFVEHSPRKNMFTFFTNHRAPSIWTDIEKKLNKPFGIWRHSRGYQAYGAFKVNEMWRNVLYTSTEINYKGIWYSFPSAMHLRDAVIPEWLLSKEVGSNKVNILDTFSSIDFYLENCVVPEGILPPNVIIV
jgi:hypothetical protein